MVTFIKNKSRVVSLSLFFIVNSVFSNLIKREINPCFYLQCLNNGKCISYNNLAHCLCTNGFKGMIFRFNSYIVLFITTHIF